MTVEAEIIRSWSKWFQELTKALEAKPILNICDSCNTNAECQIADGKYTSYWVCEDCIERYNEEELKERLSDGSIIS